MYIHEIYQFNFLFYFTVIVYDVRVYAHAMGASVKRTTLLSLSHLSIIYIDSKIKLRLMVCTGWILSLQSYHTGL